MKQIFINDEPTTYYIFEDGRLLNKKTNNFYKGTIRNGYRWFDLRWKNKKFSYSQHRLLALYYIPNPQGLDCVHHMDNNRLNNDLSNLEWISPSDNNLKINKRESRETFNPILFEPENEEWRTFRDTRYMVSNYGRVMNAETNKVLKGKKTDNGYIQYCLTFDNKKRSMVSHRLCYEVWKGYISETINHIDGNKSNNHISNLEDISQAENNRKAIYETKAKEYRRTVQLDNENNIINIYLNNAEAARAMGVRPQSIQAAIQKNRRSCGFYWKNID